MIIYLLGNIVYIDLMMNFERIKAIFNIMPVSGHSKSFRNGLIDENKLLWTSVNFGCQTVLAVFPNIFPFMGLVLKGNFFRKFCPHKSPFWL